MSGLQDSLVHSKDESDCMLATMIEQKCKIDALLLEVQVRLEYVYMYICTYIAVKGASSSVKSISYFS